MKSSLLLSHWQKPFYQLTRVQMWCETLLLLLEKWIYFKFPLYFLIFELTWGLIHAKQTFSDVLVKYSAYYCWDNVYWFLIHLPNLVSAAGYIPDDWFVNCFYWCYYRIFSMLRLSLLSNSFDWHVPAFPPHLVHGNCPMYKVKGARYLLLLRANLEINPHTMLRACSQ